MKLPLFLRNLGAEIRQRRTARGLSQRELARVAGLHGNFVGMIERGQRNVSLTTLEALALALDTKVSELVRGTERRIKRRRRANAR